MPRLLRLPILTVAGLLTACLPLAAQPIGAPRFRAVTIDTSPIAASGLPTYAARVKADISAPVAAAFAGLVSPGDRNAPTLVLRVDAVSLNSNYAGGRGMGLGGTMDDVQGAGLVIQNGRVVASYPIQASSPASAGGAYYLPGSDDRRIARAGGVLAGWVRHYLGS